MELAGVSSLGAVIFKACGFADREILVQSPVELPEDLVSGTDNWYASTCRQCPAGCGIIVRVMEGRAKKIEGNPNHPISRGKLCVRGQAGLQALYNPDRIQGPMRRIGARGSGGFENISWEAAQSDLINRLKSTSGGEVLMVTEPLRGRLAMVIKRFVEALGTKYASFEPMERTTNLRETMRRLFNQETLPEFDLENTKFLMIFGADMLETWLSTVRYNRGYGTFRQGNRERGTFVQVDSRFSMTAANADEWVHVKPGMEGTLALSMAYVIIRDGMGDSTAANQMTQGLGHEALAVFAPEVVADGTGVSANRIEHLARRFAQERPSLAIGGNSAAAHTNGTFNLMAIYSLNFLVGSIGAKGGIFFNPTPLSPGQGDTLPHTTFREWQERVDRMKKGDIKLLMVRGVDPVHGTPRALRLVDALDNVGFIVSFSSFMDDTAAQADLIMPDHTYLESWGDDVPEPSPGFNVVTYQQPVVSPFYKTRAFGDQIIEIGKQIGGSVASALPWNSFKDVVREGAQELQGLRRGSLKEDVPSDNFEAFWNGLLQRGVWYDNDTLPSTEASPPNLPTEPIRPAFATAPEGGTEFNLVLYQSISLLDGRGSNLPWLQATPDPVTTVTWDTWVDMSVEDARRLKVKPNDIVEVRSVYGAIEAPVYVNRGAPPGTISIPMGQGHEVFGRYSENRGANPLSLVAPFTDGHTGALAWNATKVKVTKTHRERTLPKFEGTVEALPAPGAEIIQIVHKS